MIGGQRHHDLGEDTIFAPALPAVAVTEGIVFHQIGREFVRKAGADRLAISPPEKRWLIALAFDLCKCGGPRPEGFDCQMRLVDKY
ncbi:hypothetical protein EV658_1082 [Phaeovulum veldkampii DSM 11550]|nr:hypothetical protein EV658_1082 [Phaeovulum veldkampii DSM 11550]